MKPGNAEFGGGFRQAHRVRVAQRDDLDTRQPPGVQVFAGKESATGQGSLVLCLCSCDRPGSAHRALRQGLTLLHSLLHLLDDDRGDDHHALDHGLPERADAHHHQTPAHRWCRRR